MLLRVNGVLAAQYRYVRRQLTGAVALSAATQASDVSVGLAPVEPGSKTDMRRFADVYLRRDGLFVLRLNQSSRFKCVYRKAYDRLLKEIRLNGLVITCSHTLEHSRRVIN